MSNQVTDLFAEVHAKINRGDEHFKLLNRLIKEWGQPDHYSFGGNYNSNRTVYIGTVRFNPRPDVLFWGLLVGDLINNYRSSLDYLVRALAIKENGIDPPAHEWRLAFPITDSKAYFQKQIRERRLSGVPASSVAVIEAAQPYNASNPAKNPLTRLRDLNDADKHRLIHVAIVNISELREIIIGNTQGPFEMAIFRDPLYDNAPILRIDFERPNPPVIVQLDLSLRIMLEEELPDGDGLTTVINNIRKEILRLVEVLAI